MAILVELAPTFGPASDFVDYALLNTSISTVTANASTDLLTVGSTHGLSAGDKVRFTSTGTLPSGISAGVQYFVLATGLTTTDLKISTTSGGSVLDITSTGSGTHSIYKAGLNGSGDLDKGLLGLKVYSLTTSSQEVIITRPTEGQIWPRGDDYQVRV